LGSDPLILFLMFHYLLLQQFVCIRKLGKILEIHLSDGIKKIQNIRTMVIVYLFVEDSRSLGYLNVIYQLVLPIF